MSSTVLCAEEWIDIVDEDEVEFIDDAEPEFDVDGDPSLDSGSNERWSKLDNLLSSTHFTLRHELAYGIEQPKDTVVNRSSLRLQWEQAISEHYFARFDGKTSYDIAFNDGRFPDSAVDEYRQQDDIRELFFQYSAGSVSVKLGKQIVIWGKADGAVVSDIMSPRDLTELVFTSIEDARRGQIMLVFDYYYRGKQAFEGITAQRQWTLVINPDVKVNEFPSAGHPYAYDFGELAISEDLIQQKRPGFSWRDAEVGLRWSQTWKKFDISFMVAEVNDDNPVFELVPGRFLATYPRYQMIGGGFNWSQGNFVWKGELGVKTNRRFNLEGSIDRRSTETIDLAFGLDYDANGRYTMSLELTNQHINENQENLLNVRRDETILYGVWSKNWFNETLTTTYTFMLQLQDFESFHRWEFEFDLTDHWRAELQLDYFSAKEDDTLLGQLADKHRIAVEVNFDF